MVYKITIGATVYSHTFDGQHIFKYALGFPIRDLDKQIAFLAWPKLAQAVVNINNPRLREEFENREVSDGDIKSCREFLTWLWEACSDEPGEVISFEPRKGKKGV